MRLWIGLGLAGLAAGAVLYGVTQTSAQTSPAGKPSASSTAPAPPAAAAPTTVVAQAGGQTITAADARRIIDMADPSLKDQIAKDPSTVGRVVRAKLIQDLILAQAHDKKWDERPDIVFRAQEARDGLIANTYLVAQAQVPADYPSEADIETAYEANKSKFLVSRQDHLAQIFVAVADTSKPAEDEAQKKIKDIRDRLGKRGADFAAIVKQSSDDHGTADKGGDLGWLREDQLIPAIRDAVAGLPENGVSEPVRAEKGYHIMKLLGTKPAGPAPLADVRDQLVRALRQNRANDLERAYVEDLVKAKPIEINEIELQNAVK